MNPFEQLLKELSTVLGSPLHPDAHQSCAILIDEKLTVQLEMDKREERLLIGAQVALLDPGKFRENVLIHALKANNLPFPQIGIFGYSNHNNQLALFDYLTIEELTGEKLADYLAFFVGKAFEWKEGIEEGALPQLSKEKHVKKHISDFRQ